MSALAILNASSSEKVLGTSFKMATICSSRHSDFYISSLSKESLGNLENSVKSDEIIYHQIYGRLNFDF